MPLGRSQRLHRSETAESKLRRWQRSRYLLFSFLAILVIAKVQYGNLLHLIATSGGGNALVSDWRILSRLEWKIPQDALLLSSTRTSSSSGNSPLFLPRPNVQVPGQAFQSPACSSRRHHDNDKCQQVQCQTHGRPETIQVLDDSNAIASATVQVAAESCKTLWIVAMSEGPLSSSCNNTNTESGVGYGYKSHYAAALQSARQHASDTLQPVLILGRGDIDIDSNANTNTNIDNTKLSPFEQWAEAQGVIVKQVQQLSFQAMVDKGLPNVSRETRVGLFLPFDIPIILQQYNLLQQPGICHKYILYTDSDVMFVNPFTQQDINSVQQGMDQGNKILSYGRDSKISRPRPVNTGVVFMDVEGFAKEVPKMLEFAARQPAFPEHDQAILYQYYANRKFLFSQVDLLPIYMHWKIYWKLDPSILSDIKIVHFHGPKPGAGVKEMADCDIDSLEAMPERYRDFFQASICCDDGKTANSILQLYQAWQPKNTAAFCSGTTETLLEPDNPTANQQSVVESQSQLHLQSKLQSNLQLHAYAPLQPNEGNKPIVSFIIPSKLDRSTLERTLRSLLQQTNSNWEAIVGIDVTITKSNETIQQSIGFPQDPRIHFRNVATKVKFRGRKANGSALVRNEIILNFATADWVAFVDDDDALSPYYVEMLKESVSGGGTSSSTNDIKREDDVIIFRMQGFPEPKSVLPPQHLKELGIGDFGISFAVRRSLFQDKGVVFIPHPSEDYFYVKNANDQGAVIGLSSCNMYFIRQEPDPSRPICGMEESGSMKITGEKGILASGGTVPTV